MKTRVIGMPKAQEYIAEGIKTLASTVGLTLGPTGRNVGISFANRYGDVFTREVLHDGVRIAQSISLEDEAINWSASILQEAAAKQVSTTGDGTTVTIVLSEAMYTQARQNIVAGTNPMLLRKGIEEGVQKLVRELTNLARPIKQDQAEHIATVSSEDPALGKLVAKTLSDIGVDGLISVEPFAGSETVVEHQEGMQLDKGYANRYFITNAARMEAILQDPLILITDKSITDLSKLKLLLEGVAGIGRRLIILTPHIGDAALAGMVNNKRKGLLSNCVIKAPSFGPHQKELLSDIAIFTGARFITEDSGDKFEDVTLKDLGEAEYVTATETDSLIVGGKGSKAQIEERIASIRKLIEIEKADFNREKHKERLAKLTSGVAVIKVGGATEVEMKERVERVKDAVAATRAAIQNGICPGGEIVFLQVREVLDRSILSEKILYDALALPFYKLISHAGLDSAHVALDIHKAITADPDFGPNYGVDVIDGEVKDLVKAGIIDPVSVPINALINASSVAIQLFTTEALVIPVKDENLMQVAGI